MPVSLVRILDVHQGAQSPLTIIWGDKGKDSAMSETEIAALMTRIKAAASLDDDLLAEAAAVLRRVFPKASAPSTAAVEPVEQALHLVDVCLPGWTIQLTGKAQEQNGHWRCSLRQSRGSDEDEVIGLGSGPLVAWALLEALLHVARQKSRT